MNNFDVWNEIKKKIDTESQQLTTFPQERDVWMSRVGKNIGFEENGGGSNFSRPVLVIKKFNNQMFLTVPLSRKQKELDFYYNFTDPFSQKTSIMLAQLKLLSIKRFGRKMYELDKSMFGDVRTKLKSFF